MMSYTTTVIQIKHPRTLNEHAGPSSILINSNSRSYVSTRWTLLPIMLAITQVPKIPSVTVTGIREVTVKYCVTTAVRPVELIRYNIWYKVE
jgi:hypothetical protein